MTFQKQGNVLYSQVIPHTINVYRSIFVVPILKILAQQQIINIFCKHLYSRVSRHVILQYFYKTD